MEKEATIQFPCDYEKLPSVEKEAGTKPKKLKLKWYLTFSALAIFILHSVISIWCLKSEVDQLRTKVILLEMRAEVDIQKLKNLQSLIYSQLEDEDNDSSLNDDIFDSDFEGMTINDYEETDNKDDNEEEESEEDDTRGDSNGVKKKREIRDYSESSVEKDLKVKNITEDKFSSEKSSGERASTEMSSAEQSSEVTSTKKSSPPTRKPHLRRKHRKYRIGSAERFFTETHSTTSTPIQVRQSRTKLTQVHGIDKNLWLQNQKGESTAIVTLKRLNLSLPLTKDKQFQHHTSPLKDTITKEEALRKGYGKLLEEVGYELETSREHSPDAVSYNMIMIHFSADTSHYSMERDSHYLGNGRMQIKSDVYKDWKPAHWTQGVGMSKYFHLHQGRVTVSTTGIYLIYAQIQYSNVQEVNGFSVFRNNEVVVQCITTSTHPDKHEIKSNTCGISTTILLQSNDSVCIKDLHHGRYVVLTPEKSYFGLVLLSPFKS